MEVLNENKYPLSVTGNEEEPYGHSLEIGAGVRKLPANQAWPRDLQEMPENLSTAIYDPSEGYMSYLEKINGTHLESLGNTARNGFGIVDYDKLICSD